MPFALSRTNEPDTKALSVGMAPKAVLRAGLAAAGITLDTETTLLSVPPEAWG